MEAFIQPSALTPEQFLGLAVGLGGFTTAVVGLRLSSNFAYVKRLYVEDYSCVVAFVFMVLNIVLSYMLVSALNSDPMAVSEKYFSTLGAVTIFSAGSAVYTAKLPLLFLFIRIFGVKTWLRRTCKILVRVSVLGFLGSATYTSVLCSPDLHADNMWLVTSCVSALTRGCIARCALSLVLDIIMFLLPLPVVQKLQLPLRRRIGLALVFMTGLLAVAASAMGLYYQTMQSQYSSTNFVNALFATVLESCVVLLVSCTASLHQLWSKIAAYRRTRLSLSDSRTKTSWSGTSARRTPKLGDTFDSFDSRSASLAAKHPYVSLSEVTAPCQSAERIDAREHLVRVSSQKSEICWSQVC